MKKELPEPARTLQFGGGRSNGPFLTLGDQLLAIREAGNPAGRIDPRLFESGAPPFWQLIENPKLSKIIEIHHV